MPEFLRHCNGMIVTPNGNIVIQTSKYGICVSRDQGTTWSVVMDNNIKGRCEDGWCFSLPYPYDGRMVFSCYDGNGGTSGGMYLDDGKTWKPFAQLNRGLQEGDIQFDARAILQRSQRRWRKKLAAD